MTAPMSDKSRPSPQGPPANGAPARPKLRVANLGNARAYDDFPALYSDSSFWGMFATQFFGAFNDNLFKQLVLLLSIAAVGAVGVSGGPAIGPALFVGPLLLINGAAGLAPLLLLVALASSGQSDHQGLAMFVFAAPFL